MGLLKGKAGFMGRARESVAELQEMGQGTTRAGLATLERLTRKPVETRSSLVFMVPVERLGASLARFAGSEVAARFPFTGTASGMAALFFGRKDALGLAELLLGAKEGSVKRLGELEQSTIAETANIALNGCLNELAKQEGVRFQPDVPECTRGVQDVSSFLRPPGEEEHAVVVETVFSEPSRGLEGAMVVVIGLA